MPLSDTQIRSAKPRDKAFKLSDGEGLYLLITPKGKKYWRFKYRFQGKEKLLALGVYPDVTLADARNMRSKARNQVANEIDPSIHRQEEKRSQQQASENSLEAITREWCAKFLPKWTTKHADRVRRQFNCDVIPWLGKRPIAEITTQELHNTLKRIEQRGAIETAHRTLQSCAQVFRYAIATGRAKYNPADNLRGALPSVKKKHHASLTDTKAIGALMRAINDYHGHFVTKCAMQLAPLLFVRPGELRHAEWSEFNFETAEWRIPAEKMKMRAIHIVPLSTQTISILQELHPLTGNGKYLFPSIRTPARPMSENTVNAGLRRLGYTNEEMTGHGFRSIASTLLNEHGWNRDAIERQLAHGERNSVRAAYNFAEYLPERKKMMQWWADFLDELSQSALILPFKTA